MSCLCRHLDRLLAAADMDWNPNAATGDAFDDEELAGSWGDEAGEANKSAENTGPINPGNKGQEQNQQSSAGCNVADESAVSFEALIWNRKVRVQANEAQQLLRGEKSRQQAGLSARPLKTVAPQWLSKAVRHYKAPITKDTVSGLGSQRLSSNM